MKSKLLSGSWNMKFKFPDKLDSSIPFNLNLNYSCEKSDWERSDIVVSGVDKMKPTRWMDVHPSTRSVFCCREINLRETLRSLIRMQLFDGKLHFGAFFAC